MKIEVVGNEEEYWFNTGEYGVVVFIDNDVCRLSEEEATKIKLQIENALKTSSKLESGAYVLVDKHYIDYLKNAEKELWEMRKRYG